jgi:ornithine cyclodeaminase/alanine dehydrogenase-like protein (mu-crystallin family)
MLYLTENDVRQLLPMDEAVRLMRKTFQALADGSALNQPRRRLFLPTGTVLHSMAGSIGRYLGTKFYSANAKHGAHFFFHLFDAETASPLAILEANYLGQIRTGAASGYATDVLASPSARRMGVIGSGFQARSQIEAVLQVRNLDLVKVWSRHEEGRKKFAAECGTAFGVDVRATQTAEEAVRDCDIVVTATWAKDPVLDSAWVSDGAHVNAMGSNNPQRRELPEDLVRRAGLIVADSIEQARMEAGDLLLAWTPDEWETPKLVELKDAPSAHRPENAVTIFKSVGLGVEDVAAGAFVYEKALAAGAGRPVYS